MKLTGKQLKEFHAALLDAYPSDSDLTMMVKFELEEDLGSIASGSNQRDLIFALIRWADSVGRIEDLILGARRYNSGNTKLNEWVDRNGVIGQSPHSTSPDSRQTDAGGTNNVPPNSERRGCFFTYGRLSLSVVVVTLLGVMLYTFLMNLNGRYNTWPHLQIEYLRNRIEKIFVPPVQTPSVITIDPSITPTATSISLTATPEPSTATPEPPTATPELEAGATRIVNGITYVYIPAGSFTMGSNVFDDEKPPHPISVDAFWMMQTEVTKAQYIRCVGDGACTEPNDLRIADSAFANHPVVYVTWHQANAFAEWVGGRLPTEAEWEYACRGTDGRIYPWGDEAPNQDRLNYSFNVGDTTEVGRYPVGSNGLYDMAGNVREWTSTQYKDYPYAADDGREGQDGDSNRTLRGGSFVDNEYNVRCAFRGHNVPSLHTDFVGFRVVVVPLSSSPGFLSSESSGP